MSGKVEEVEAPHRLAWSFAGDEYGFDLVADGDGCRLTFTHAFDDRGRAAQHAAGWDAYLARLDSHLAGGHLSENDAHESWGDVHERYAEAFGVDPEPGRRFWSQTRADQP